VSEHPHREWAFHVQDMIGFAERVLAYTSDMGLSRFVSSQLNYDATIRNLERIGEAATHIPESIRARHAEIPWRLVIATRNRLIHGYLGVDNETLWSIMTEDVPPLLPQLQRLLDQQAERRPPA